ncbi:MAG TPA: hypothetical protein VKD47_08435, partial [Miltoncostaeaceae bacterium]|nr:hypothetical protein [Miltoncostaeaceae bacterium]
AAPAAAAAAREALNDLDLGELAREGATVRLRASRGPTALTRTIRALDAHGLEPEHLRVREPSLDDVFLALTGHHTEIEEVAA